MPGIYDTETWRNVDPRLQAAFLAMAAEAPGEITLTSGWRSNDTQRRLYAQKPGLAAPPGHSNHEFGLALDLGFQNAATRRWVHANAARFGLWFPMDYEPWHIQLIGVDRHNVNGMGNRGGGRNAFPPGPDGRFPNPYDVMSSFMDAEDNTDPLTQFNRIVAMVTSPDSSLTVPVGAMGSPQPLGKTPDMTSGAAAVATGQTPAARPTEFQPAYPGDVERVPGGNVEEPRTGRTP